ncbi:MAG TPA: hypothetical protein V6D47_10045 [Oscillatoriaceae cyanobacterium]
MFKRLLALLALLPLGGCTWLFGYGTLPQPEPPLRVAADTQQARSGPLQLSVRFRGAGEREISARNLWGRAARAVDPYGEDVLVFEVTAANTGTDPLILNAPAATLTLANGQVYKPLTLDDYRDRWPTWPIVGADEAADQHFAYQAVLTTILLQRMVPPGQSAAGRLAFAGVTGAMPMSLRVPFSVGLENETVTLDWRSP